jgi:hypothetical protein
MGVFLHTSRNMQLHKNVLKGSSIKLKTFFILPPQIFSHSMNCVLCYYPLNLMDIFFQFNIVTGKRVPVQSFLEYCP